MVDYWRRPEFFEAGVVYKATYTLLREFWEPTFKMKKDRKRALRQLRENHPEAYQNAFRSFWENKRDIQLRRKVKQAYYDKHRDDWRKDHHPWSMPPPPPPFTEAHIRLWLEEKGLVPKYENLFRRR